MNEKADREALMAALVEEAQADTAEHPEPDALLDYQAGALDSKTGVQVLEALDHINKEFGTTTAVITHAAEIRKMAHRVLYFQDGNLSRVETNDHRVDPSDIVW